MASNPQPPALTPQQIAAICKQRIDFFIYTVLGYKITPFHSSMLSFQLKTPHSMNLCPRGGGKSTILDIAYVLWRLVLNPNIRIAIVSASQGQAETFLREIKQHIEYNDKFRSLFGNMVGTLWNNTEIILANRTKIMKEPTIAVYGAEGAITGYHFDLIICDDLVTEKNSRTEAQREKVKTWFYTTLMPTLEPDTGELRVIGTRYHEDDLYGWLAGKDEEGEFNDDYIGPHVNVVPAIQETFTVDANGEVLADKDGNPIANEESFWPEKFPLEKLKQIRKKSGSSIFLLQYQNDAHRRSGGVINPDDLDKAIAKTLPEISSMRIFMGVDPAISLKKRADYFAVQVIGVDQDNHIWDLYNYKGKLSFEQQIQKVTEIAQQWGPEVIGVEAVAYQAALAEQVAKNQWLNVEPINTKLDKAARTQIFSAVTEQRRLHLRPQSTGLYRTIVDMPNVEHDDDFDAMYIAVEVAKKRVLTGVIAGWVPNSFRRSLI